MTPAHRIERQSRAAACRRSRSRAARARAGLVSTRSSRTSSLHGLDPVAAEDLHRRGREPQHDPPSRLARGCAARTPRGSRGCAARSSSPPALPADREVARIDHMHSLSSPSSSSSGLVNAACSGPRRPRTTTSRSRLSRERLERVVGDVGHRELLVRSVSMRATSSATLPLPIDDRALAREVELGSRKSGWPLYQPTNSLGRRAARQVLAGNAAAPVALRLRRPRPRRRTTRRASTWVDVTADLDVAEEAKAGLRGGLLEHARDRLDLRVVGRDPAADQAPGVGSRSYMSTSKACWSSWPAA